MITIASESNYAHSLTFDSIEAVEAEAADCSRYANRADYPSGIAYIANLLDLPESHVHVEEVITLTRSQLRKLEADMARLVSEMKEGEAWPTDAYDLVADTICAWVLGENYDANNENQPTNQPTRAEWWRKVTDPNCGNSPGLKAKQLQQGAYMKTISERLRKAADLWDELDGLPEYSIQASPDSITIGFHLHDRDHDDQLRDCREIISRFGVSNWDSDRWSLSKIINGIEITIYPDFAVNQAMVSKYGMKSELLPL